MELVVIEGMGEVVKSGKDEGERVGVIDEVYGVGGM